MLISLDVEYPYVHDLAHLLSMLEDAGVCGPNNVRRAGELTPYAMLTRYPGPARPITEREYIEAVDTAEAIVEWVGERLWE